MASSPAGVFSTPDELIDALYETVSGPAGAEPDWDRERSLYLPGAVLLRASRAGADTPEPGLMDVEGFIAGCRDYLRDNDFYELELSRSVRRFGDLAHVLSAYQTSHDPGGREPIARGTHSLQLCFDGKRWWIVSAMWDLEPEPARGSESE